VNVLFTFETVSATLDCELIFKEMKTPFRIIPVPKVLSSSCGYALTMESGDPAGLCKTLHQGGTEYVKVFRCEVLPDEFEGRKNGAET
jgi:hypothetical protein